MSLDQSFFDLGGDSLLLLQMHGSLRATLRRDFPMTALFQFPTVRALARHLSAPPDSADSAATARERARSQRAAFARLRPAVSKTTP